MISFTLVIIFTHLYKHKYDLHNPFSVAHMYVISERTICHFSLIAYGSFNYRAVVSESRNMFFSWRKPCCSPGGTQHRYRNLRLWEQGCRWCQSHHEVLRSERLKSRGPLLSKTCIILLRSDFFSSKEVIFIFYSWIIVIIIVIVVVVITYTFTYVQHEYCPFWSQSPCHLCPLTPQISLSC